MDGIPTLSFQLITTESAEEAESIATGRFHRSAAFHHCVERERSTVSVWSALECCLLD